MNITGIMEAAAATRADALHRQALLDRHRALVDEALDSLTELINEKTRPRDIAVWLTRIGMEVEVRATAWPTRRTLDLERVGTIYLRDAGVRVGQDREVFTALEPIIEALAALLEPAVARVVTNAAVF
ncbi:hypothetical protein PVT71_12320 [Salipiger sp. H15]|uniref:Uncharacterized protein n=1 Tax=Alloyangia sp. H15 TaxID=3029062 RepID=A0AAU8AFE8_9RHOB